MHLLITGVTGFVGSRLVNKMALLSEMQLTAAVRSASSFVPAPAAKVLYQNIRSVFESPIGLDAVVHLAGKAHDTRNTTDEQAYMEANYELTKQLYDAFLKSEAHTFVFVSSIKAVHNEKEVIENEEDTENPVTAYGRSKRMAEEYILKNLPGNKKVYILRPCLIYGPGVKANMQALVKFATSGIPFPFAAFSNKRSLLSIDNLIYTIHYLLHTTSPSGVYNVCDNEGISTADMVRVFARAAGKNPRMLPVPVFLWKTAAKMGDLLKLPFNSEKLKKLTGTMIVGNKKICNLPGFQFPVKTEEGLKEMMR